ncbi:MAG: ornithine carbamoyltransferase [Thermodesulfobacteriota bacterium]
MKHLLTIFDLTKEEIEGVIYRAAVLKAILKEDIPYVPLTGKTLGLIFDKSSTRTRVSFEVAMHQLGGSSIFISPGESQIGRGEPVKDTVRVLSRFVDALVIRTYAQETIEEFARYAKVPVINGLTNLCHPCQILSDLFTIYDKKGRYEGIKIVWIGDGNNMAHSWLKAAARLGLNLTLACPEGYEPDMNLIEEAQKEAGSKIRLINDPYEAVKGADVVNTDVWVSMGQEEEREERLKAFQGYQVNEELLKRAKRNCIVMHCLPAHRGEEITDDVIESKNSVIFDQAENKLYMHRAILEKLLVKQT